VTESLPQLAIKAKALAYRNRSRRNWVWLGGVLCGAAASGLWLFYFPNDLLDSKPILFTSLLIGLITAGLVLVVWHKKFYPENAKCPSCGYSWELKEGSYVPLSEQMDAWDKCPGCALPMNDFMLERASRAEQ
jgi:4-amino-4-deoxy-L-arabinose transferase-like glycosyltransferase